MNTMNITSIKSITLYENRDIYRGKNEVNPLGFDKIYSLGEMIDIAALYKCNLIVRNGYGKWYLKKGVYEVIKQKLENSREYNKQFCWLIEYNNI